jgi:hypothetical protein
VQGRRHGGFGLHTVALAAICLGGAGLLALPAARAFESPALVLAGEAAIRVAMVLLCLFIAGTFRPGPVGAACACACALLLVAAVVWDVLAQPSLLHYDYTRVTSHANQLSIAIPFAWSSAESVVLWQRARRRLALGLCEPGVVERYLLWSATTACFVLVCMFAIASGVAESVGSKLGAELAQAMRGLLYVAISVCVWRGIFPGLSASGANGADGFGSPTEAMPSSSR